MKKFSFSFLCLCACIVMAFSAMANDAPAAKDREFYELRVYHAKTETQLARIDSFLRGALLPFLHKEGIKTVGVFKALANDTAADKKIFVLIPHASLNKFAAVANAAQKDKSLETSGAAYLNAPYNDAPFTRIETILIQAFDMMPRMAAPALKGPRKDRVYELRSYEGPTEKLYQNKVHMFNEGGEVALFKRLGFNAVFYGEVLAGSRMPNLMYMTTFENMEDRNAHWKSFGDDPEWKKLSALPQYQHNVSRGDTYFLVPTDYSDL
jgi:hypothetical protein